MSLDNLTTVVWMWPLVQDSLSYMNYEVPCSWKSIMQVFFSWDLRTRHDLHFCHYSLMFGPWGCFCLTGKGERQNWFKSGKTSPAVGVSPRSVLSVFHRWCNVAALFPRWPSQTFFKNKCSPRFSFNRWLRFFNLTINEHATPFFIWANTFA